MPTKSIQKPAAPKSAAPKTAKAAVRKVAPKAGGPKKTTERKLARAHPPAAAEKSDVAPVPQVTVKPVQAPTTPHDVKRVSLIDEERPEKKSEKDGHLKTKSTILPPISRIRASLETPTIPAS